MRARLAFICYLVFVASVPSPVAAHEGHSHDEPVKTARPVAPRGEATAGDMQLVAVLRNGELVVYLDRLSNNEPITDALIEALTPNGTEKAEVNVLSLIHI